MSSFCGHYNLHKQLLGYFASVVVISIISMSSKIVILSYSHRPYHPANLMMGDGFDTTVMCLGFLVLCRQLYCK